MLPEQAFAGHRIPETDVARGLASEVNGTTPRVECAIAARVVKSVDTADLKSAAARRAGSSPAPGTNQQQRLMGCTRFARRTDQFGLLHKPSTSSCGVQLVIAAAAEGMQAAFAINSALLDADAASNALRDHKSGQPTPPDRITSGHEVAD